MKRIIAIIATVSLVSGCGIAASQPSRDQVLAACSFDDVHNGGDDYIALAMEGISNGMYKGDVTAELVDACVALAEQAAAIRQEVADSEEVQDACRDCVTTVMNHVCAGLPPSCSLQH